MDIIFILLLTVPIFYIYGIICFIRNFGDKNNPDPEKNTIYRAVIQELTRKASETPNKTLKELAAEYKEKESAQLEHPVHESKPVEDAPKPHETHKHDTEKNIFESWYSNNSINLLLYIGAFLIVSAAAIFVGFQWETITGVVKALLLTAVALAFFGFGAWFYSIPKIRNAGETFISISAVLIPVLGAAWYNFVLHNAGVPVGIVWLITSLGAVVAYLGLALFMRTTFYSYASTIATFSLVLSLVKSFGLAQDFYILAGIVASFILFLFSYYSKRILHDKKDVMSIPAAMSSQIAMPITLVYGFAMAISEDIF